MRNGILRTFVVLSLSLLLASSALAASWKIDNAHSSVEFKVRHLFSKVGGNFGQFEGTIEFDPEQPTLAKVEATIQTASIDTANEGRDKHLRSADFFDVEKYATIKFVSSKVEKKDGKLVVSGELTMRGVSKPISFPIEFHGAGPNGWGGTAAGFSAELVLNRKDFGIVWNKALDQGGTVLGEEVTIALEIEAVAAKETAGR